MPENTADQPPCERCRRYAEHTDGLCQRCLLKRAGWVRADRHMSGETWCLPDGAGNETTWVKFSTAWRRYRASQR